MRKMAIVAISVFLKMYGPEAQVRSERHRLSLHFRCHSAKD